MEVKDLYIITVDGESATGKSSVSDEVSKLLGYKHLDAGVIFRTIGYLMDFHQIELNALSTSLKEKSFLKEVHFDGQLVLLNGKDISLDIHNESSALRAAKLGTYEYFQNWFVTFLREQVAQYKSPCVVSGRIGGNIIFPYASHKFYLKANIETKVARRFLQLNSNATSTIGFEEVKKSIQARDDLRNIISYWNIELPGDTVIIDTSFITIQDVVKGIHQVLSE